MDYAAERAASEARRQAVLAEARAELEAAERRQGAVVRSTNVTFHRPARRPPCKCGGRHFARGLCSRCYFREYNKGRPERGREAQQRHPERFNEYRRRRRRLLRAQSQGASPNGAAA